MHLLRFSDIHVITTVSFISRISLPLSQTVQWLSCNCNLHFLPAAALCVGVSCLGLACWWLVNEQRNSQIPRIPDRRTSHRFAVSIMAEAEPHSSHASKHDSKPKELSKNSIDWAALDDKHKNDTSRLFTKLAFNELGLKGHLADVITDTSSNGFGLQTCTAVQSMTFPIFFSKPGGKRVLIKSQTGSGKTLTYLLPILQDLLSLSPAVQRQDGCRAVIVAPTRELCLQISEVISKLTKCCVNLVGGCIVGGEKKKSEKARLRKGVVILVGTPGRLLDHLRLTESFSLQLLRFIVLDEIDRLLDMGFEQSVLEILSRIRGAPLPGLKAEALAPSKHSANDNLQQKWAKETSITAKKCVDTASLSYMLVSATLTAAVRKLAWPILSNPKSGGADACLQLVDGDNLLVKAIGNQQELDDCAVYIPQEVDLSNGTVSDLVTLSNVPTGLQQFYMLVSCKWRLPALISFLELRKKQKVIVFFSTCDAVDYHALLLKHMLWPQSLDSKGAYEGDDKPVKSNKKAQAPQSQYKSSGVKQAIHLDPLESAFDGLYGKDTKMYRLHGKLPQDVRKETYLAFSSAKRGILLCTDVAARGLDLQTVDWILQYDAPCDTLDYVHRIGRTARRGRQGNAMLFLLPTEALYITLLASHGLQLTKASSQSMLTETAKTIPGAGKFKNIDEMTAVILQRRAENTIYDNKHLVEAAIQAYRSYVRAYGTHSADAKGIFKVKDLHLGHLSKTFALRDRPTEMNAKEDVIAKIFNGDFMSRDSPLRKAQADKAAVAVEKKRKRQQEQDDREDYEDEESAGGEEAEDDNDDDEEQQLSQHGEPEDGDAEEMDADAPEESDPVDVEEQEEDEDEDEEEQRPAKKSKSSVPAEMVKASASLASSMASLKRTKLRQRAQMQKGMQKGSKRGLSASGKFRSAGGYFKKKLRSEFAAN